MYNTAQYDAAKEQADASAFEEVLRKAKQTDADKLAGKVAGRRVLTAEEKAEKLDKELKEACQGFEAMYMELMYKKMRDTVPEDELFGDSNADKIWQSMLDSEMMQQAESRRASARHPVRNVPRRRRRRRRWCQGLLRIASRGV